ncbi:flagellar motor switch protein FliN [Patulibacter brassicae]|jgi:flagellar motor switch protein FliN/FliY|uniref:Flagellar motor switch protein FliN n=1 Tax=Patulibacter brassicae TaxID=1705717 RepID=A0ABU4VNE9_9ACTN|nr:flagellar motor switch protein FliN [Patulibacter brassicae]MDX8152852.1 flagellar motor switch protein FliN [Patulibacter brassicae]
MSIEATTDWHADDDLSGAAPTTTVEDDLARLHDVPVELAVEIGRTTMTLGQALRLGPGSIVELRRIAGEPVDLLAGGKPIARGEVVVVDEEFGLRITEMVTDGHDAPATPATDPAVEASSVDLDADQAAVPAADHPE